MLQFIPTGVLHLLDHPLVALLLIWVSFVLLYCVLITLFTREREDQWYL